MKTNKTNTAKEVQTTKEAELHAQIEALTQKLVSAETRIATNRATKLKFTTESCKNSNTFHVSFSSLFSSEYIKRDYAELFVRHDEVTNTDVYKSELRAVLIKRIVEHLI